MRRQALTYMRLADTIYCTFGGGGGDAASSTAPVGQHPETDGTTGREKMRKGGPDKGGIVAGGPGSGCEGPNCGRKHSIWGLKRITGYWERLNSGERESMEQLLPYFEKDKSKHTQFKISKNRPPYPKSPLGIQSTSGGQSEGSSLTARRFYVVDGQGRVLHTFQTREEAESASAGNRYSKVVTHVEQEAPPEAAEVMDYIRRRPGDTQVRTFRRSNPFPNTPYPGSPQGR